MLFDDVQKQRYHQQDENDGNDVDCPLFPSLTALGWCEQFFASGQGTPLFVERYPRLADITNMISKKRKSMTDNLIVQQKTQKNTKKTQNRMLMLQLDYAFSATKITQYSQI